MEATAARHLEAAGATSTSFEFRGTTVTIPLRLEDWPLDAIRAGKSGRAIKALLGTQRPPMRTRTDAIELTHRMADACGVTPLPETPADERGMFGAVPTLLDAVDNHGDDLEADLRRFYGIDYRDASACTLRQVWVMIRRLPAESATMFARHNGESPWTRGEIINARMWEMWTRKPYPGRPPTKAELDEWRAKRAENDDKMDRLAEREAYYKSGQNMRDAGRDPGPRQPPQSDPTERALAVAMKNARRSQRGRSNGRTQRPGTQPGQPKPGFKSGRWDNAGSAW